MFHLIWHFCVLSLSFMWIVAVSLLFHICRNRNDFHCMYFSSAPKCFQSGFFFNVQNVTKMSWMEMHLWTYTPCHMISLSCLQLWLQAVSAVPLFILRNVYVYVTTNVSFISVHNWLRLCIDDGRVSLLHKAFTSTSQSFSVGFRSASWWIQVVLE